MSIEVMRLVWSRAPYKGNSLLTLLALADWSNDDGMSWPSIETIAAKSRQSERSAQYAMKQFEDDGVVSREDRANTSSVYTINICRLESLPDKYGRGRKICTPARPVGAKQDVPGMQNTTEIVSQIAPNTSMNHQKEPSDNSVLEKKKKIDDLILWAWGEYIRLSGKNPKTYTLTDTRRDKCKTRVSELLKIYPDDFRAVAAQLRYAIERLMESEFHREKGFIEWDKHLFRSQEQLERWINTPSKAGPDKPSKKSPWQKVQSQASGA